MPTLRRDETSATAMAEGALSRIRQRLQQAWGRPETGGTGLPDSVLDLMPEPTVLVDARDCIQAANRRAREQFDLAPGASLAEAVLAPDHRAGHLAHLGHVASDGRTTAGSGAAGPADDSADPAHERVVIQADGAEARVAVRVSAVAGSEPPLFAVSLASPQPEVDAVEVDARRRTLRAVLDALPDPVFAVGRSGRVLFRNRASVREVSQGDGATTEALSPADWQAADDAMRGGTPAVGEEAVGEGIRLTTRIPVRGRTGDVVGLVAMSRDVTAQRADRARLDDARRAAEAAARAGGEVLATTSHEVRTLMSGVTGMTALLLDTDLDTEQRDFVDTIRTSSDTLLRVVNDVLDLSKMDAGMLEIESQPYDLRQAIQDSLAVVAQQARTKELVLSGTVDAAVPAVIAGDAVRVRQVLANLLTNAVKFTDEGSVQVHVEPDGTTGLAFSVQDTGVGIAPERLDAVFEPFAQADASTARTHGGTGLGLTICRRLVTMMGGELTAESAPGGGSVFRFTVAVDADAPVPPEAWPTLATRADSSATPPTSTSPVTDSVPPAPGPTTPVTDSTSAEPDSAPTVPAGPSSVPLPPSAPETGAPQVDVPEADVPDRPSRSKMMDMDSMLPSASVLLVEDDPVMQKVTRMTLLRLGYRPTVVDNGRKGVMAVRTNRYDVVLMDIMMPVMDGLEATRHIRADPGPHPPPAIVMLTANAMKGDRDLGMAAGCDAYLTKPVSAQELATTIEQAIRAQSEVA